MTEVRIDFKVDRLGGYGKGELSNVNGPGGVGTVLSGTTGLPTVARPS